MVVEAQVAVLLVAQQPQALEAEAGAEARARTAAQALKKIFGQTGLEMFMAPVGVVEVNLLQVLLPQIHLATVVEILVALVMASSSSPTPRQQLLELTRKLLIQPVTTLGAFRWE